MAPQHDDDQPPALLEVRGLTKRYDDLVAVNDVDLSIHPGEIVALLGPNGAGKTTMIGCITGLITRFEGQIRVAGHDVRRDYTRTRRIVGLVPQELNYDGFFTVREILDFQGGYFGVRPGSGRAEELLRAFALWDKRDQSSRWLSGGMKRRLMICKALMHQPLLLFLDEPTAGVDVGLREELWDYVRGLRRGGTTIVLTTHYLEEAEQLADRIGILHHGRLLHVQDRKELMTTYAQQRLVVDLSAVPEPPLLDQLAALGLDVQRPSPQRLELRTQTGQPEGETIDQVLRMLHGAGHTLTHLEARRSSLEEIFRDLIARDEAPSKDSTRRT